MFIFKNFYHLQRNLKLKKNLMLKKINFKGIVVILKGNKEVKKLYKNESFGEKALYFSGIRNFSAKIFSNEAKCIALGRKALTKILGDQVQAITYRNIQRWAFDKSLFLNKLLKIQREKIVDAMDIHNVKEGEIIFSANSKIKDVVIVIEGAIKYVRL